MADRGFDIEETVGIIQASLHIHVPEFTKQKDQLSPIEVEETRTIFLALIDRIICVCCALNNVYNPIVPLD